MYTAFTKKIFAFRTSILAVILAGLLFLGFIAYGQYESLQNISSENESLQNELESIIYENHLLLSQLIAEDTDVTLEDLAQTDPELIANFLKEYQRLNELIARNKNVGINVSEVEATKSILGVLLLESNYDGFVSQVAISSSTLDAAYAVYIEEQRVAQEARLAAEAAAKEAAAKEASQASQPSTQKPSEGYSLTSVSTNKGTFSVHLIKLPLSKAKVKTLTANSENCKDNCPTKSLEQFVKENKAYGGMHGTYFCPPDYAACAGKVNSYDFAVYNSNLGKWLSSDSLGWNKTSLITFNGKTPAFYKDTTAFGRSPVTAGMVNYPALLSGGSYAIDEQDLTSFQLNNKGPRGAIGYDDSNLYLAIVLNATVPETAEVLQKLGVKNALNLDGGGSSAMYINGSYIVGPGRALPNAIVFEL